MPCDLLDWTSAEMDEPSTLRSMTVELDGPLESTGPMTPADVITGMPEVTPDEVPRSMVTVELQESLAPDTMVPVTD